MGQEYFIKSQNLEDKVRKSLPSQGGLGAGFDLSASTTIIPIIDLTETAEGSVLRQDLQTASSFTTTNSFNQQNGTVVTINNTGYWQLIGTSVVTNVASGASFNQFLINDGVTDKAIWVHSAPDNSTINTSTANFKFVVFLEAGHSLKTSSFSVNSIIAGSFRQIASIDGTLTNP